MQNLVLSGQDAISASCGDLEGFKLVNNDIIDEWRWGNVYEITIKREGEDRLWGTTYREQSGDNYHNSLEDEDEVEFYPVVAEEVMTVVYKRLKD